MKDFEVKIGTVSLGLVEAEDEWGARRECARLHGAASEAELIEQLRSGKLTATELMVDPLMPPWWQIEVCVAGMWRPLGREYMLPTWEMARDARLKMIKEERVDSERCRVVEVPA
jgi:hypothetical protein